MTTNIISFSERVKTCDRGPLRAQTMTTLQINLGKKCNLACTHCHVSAGPNSKETMSRDTVEACLKALADPHFATLDITGGAPELHQDLAYMIETATAMGKKVMVRTNLVALTEPKLAHLLQIYKANQVTIVASLPCYGQENVDSQRGDGTYTASIQVLQKLNTLGYGSDPGLELDLVYNPGGPFLPGSQAQLEEAYKAELAAAWGICFNHLFTITNLPLGRFKAGLEASGELAAYNKLLADAFNPQTLPGLMCLNQLSVGWDGSLYDCDFNQVTQQKCKSGVANIKDFTYEALAKREVALGNHCYGCTAGVGSSCGGALV